MWHPFFWDLYAEVAAELGLTWSRHAPDAITVDALDAGKPRVYVDDELVTPRTRSSSPRSTRCPTSRWTSSTSTPLYAVLEQLGFYLPFPPSLSPIANDKLATLLYFAGLPGPADPDHPHRLRPRRRQAPLRGRRSTG